MNPPVLFFPLSASLLSYWDLLPTIFDMSKRSNHVVSSRNKDRYTAPTSSNGYFNSDATVHDSTMRDSTVSLSQQQQQRQTLAKRTLQNDDGDEDDDEVEEVNKVVDEEEIRYVTQSLYSIFSILIGSLYTVPMSYNVLDLEAVGSSEESHCFCDWISFSLSRTLFRGRGLRNGLASFRGSQTRSPWHYSNYEWSLNSASLTESKCIATKKKLLSICKFWNS